MEAQARIDLLEGRLNRLTNSDKENANIVRKIERELRKLKGIPKLDVKYTFATNVQAYGSGDSKTKKK